MEGKMFLMLLTMDYFQKENKKNTLDKQLKILNPKQMLQRLPIVLSQIKAGKISINLLNKILQIIYFLFGVKKLLKNYITI